MKKLIKKITHWEAWPFKILYAPIAPFWFYYMLKSRSVWFFTPSNPKITFGGLDGEPKKEMYELLPKSYYPKTINVLHEEDFRQVVQKIENSGFEYPFIVKPDIGCQGILFRKIDQESQLQNYHQNAPVEYLIQEFVTYHMEVSVFYIRHPKNKKGKVTGFLHKIPMQVVGDGVSTLEQLIHQHPKAKKRIQELFEKHKSQWNQVIEKGEKYMLSYAANHNRGAHFVDLKEHIDDELVSIFDEISNSIDDFYYGRYDIICNSIEDLKQKKNFSILEYNGRYYQDNR